MDPMNFMGIMLCVLSFEFTVWFYVNISIPDRYANRVTRFLVFIAVFGGLNLFLQTDWFAIYFLAGIPCFFFWTFQIIIVLNGGHIV